MRNSLLLKLLGTFLLVTIIGSSLIFWMTSQATQSAFNLYSTRSGQSWAVRLAPLLAEYYTRYGSWMGVETLVQADSLSAAGQGAGRTPNGGGNAGQGAGFGRQFYGGMTGSGQRVLLTDLQGIVVMDTRGEMLGKQLSQAELKNGSPVIQGEAQIATVLVTPNEFASPNTPAGEFLASVNRSILISALIAGVVALLLGAFLFFQITAPLRQLNAAAHAIAEGDLTRRVNIQSRDELGDLGQAFNDMAGSLNRSETQRHNMVADIAHELRTPLTVIRANLEGMMDDVLPFDKKYIQAVYTETLLLNRMVDDLRLLSLAEAGELKLECGRTDAGHLIRQVAERLAPQLLSRNINLKLDIPDNLPAVWADSDRLTQIVNNLLANAMRYTPPQGEITIKLTPDPDKTHSLQIAITDSGVGIDRETLPYVFDRFYRADKSRTRTSGGSGLGLAIVKQLVEAHGGHISAVSPVFQGEDGKSYGTCMLFTLPVTTS